MTLINGKPDLSPQLPEPSRGARSPARHPAPLGTRQRLRQCDEAAEYPEGTLVLNGPNSERAVVSSDGCVVLAIWTGRVVTTRAP